MITYDIGIVGAGPAGLFAALRIAKEHKNIKTIIFDLGRPQGKRKRAGEGWLGYFPSGDGKLYLSDLQKISEIAGTRKTNSSFKWFSNYLSDISNLDIIKDNGPKISVEKKIKKAGFNIIKNDYIQLYPKDIHILSKKIVKDIEDFVDFSFDNEIYKISKNKNTFIVESEKGEFACKKLLICTGRSGWRWAQSLYENFGIIEENDIAKFGIRVEIAASFLKNFNNSTCNIINNDYEIGPLCWEGTVIPEDHIDLVISSFRSNEDRWKTDKVSFNLIGNRFFKDKGFEQTNRLGQLTFILANDRVVKEKVSSLLSKRSKISIIPEYDWLSTAIDNISQFIPDIKTKGYFHIPTIIPIASKIRLGKAFSTEIDGMYCAGEAAGVIGILSAILSATIAADDICK